MQVKWPPCTAHPATGSKTHIQIRFLENLDDILIFTPYYKSVIWGGNRIATLKGEAIDVPRLGESWELSAVPGCESVVCQGPHTGCTLSEMCRRFGSALLGDKVHAKFGNEFPILVKILDACDKLSLQVHPDDNVASHPAGHTVRGKNELWYVLSSTADSRIYSGLAQELTPHEYETRVADHSIMQAVASHPSLPGQFYFIPAGTIHTCTAGNLIAEIQESSDVTYRIYDFNRRDKDGNLRQLHTTLAREAINFTYPNPVEPTARVYPLSTRGVVVTPHFTTDLLKVHGQTAIQAEPGSFTVLMVTDGEVTVSTGRTSIRLTKGHTALIPATTQAYTITGTATLLKVHC